MTLEDEDGMMNVIVRPDIYALYSQVIREAPILVMEGLVPQRGSVTNLVAHQCKL